MSAAPVPSAPPPPAPPAAPSPAPPVARQPPPAAPPPAAPASAPPVHARRRWRGVAAPLGAVLLLAVVALYLYSAGRYAVYTDDATVDAHVVAVVPQVAAYVTALHVDDNSQVAAGELMVQLDPREFTIAVQSARASLKDAIATAHNVAARQHEQLAVIAGAEAKIAGDQARLTFVRQDLQRYTILTKTGASTTQRWQQAQSDIGQAEAAVASDVAARDAAHDQLGVLQTEQQQADAAADRARAALAQAELNLSYTHITAVEAGSIAHREIDDGSFVQPGQVLFSLVPDHIFVTANYNETQLTHVRPGQPVRIWVDAFPGGLLHGRVDSLQRGTGSEFALLPPENATGNFIKVVQRVPVKIDLDADPDEARLLAPGMSVETSIAIARRPWWDLLGW
jgi:membrane fusion protein, multidrug efflux system